MVVSIAEYFRHLQRMLFLEDIKEEIQHERLIEKNHEHINRNQHHHTDGAQDGTDGIGEEVAAVAQAIFKGLYGFLDIDAKVRPGPTLYLHEYAPELLLQQRNTAAEGGYLRGEEIHQCRDGGNCKQDRQNDCRDLGHDPLQPCIYGIQQDGDE
jgi:hypothetical protein